MQILHKRGGRRGHESRVRLYGVDEMRGGVHIGWIVEMGEEWGMMQWVFLGLVTMVDVRVGDGLMFGSLSKTRLHAMDSIPLFVVTRVVSNQSTQHPHRGTSSTSSRPLPTPTSPATSPT